MKREMLISGDVQGVGFRYTAREKADELGVTLHAAENLPDGNVRLVVEGGEAALRKFVEWAKIGPPLARVEQVEMVQW